MAGQVERPHLIGWGRRLPLSVPHQRTHRLRHAPLLDAHRAVVIDVGHVEQLERVLRRHRHGDAAGAVGIGMIEPVAADMLERADVRRLGRLVRAIGVELRAGDDAVVIGVEPGELAPDRGDHLGALDRAIGQLLRGRDTRGGQDEKDGNQRTRHGQGLGKERYSRRRP